MDDEVYQEWKCKHLDSTHALHCWSQRLLAPSESIPASSSWHYWLSVLGHTDSHIRVHLHNPASDWSQFNGGCQSISIKLPNMQKTKTYTHTMHPWLTLLSHITRSNKKSRQSSYQTFFSRYLQLVSRVANCESIQLVLEGMNKNIICHA